MPRLLLIDVNALYDSWRETDVPDELCDSELEEAQQRSHGPLSNDVGSKRLLSYIVVGIGGVYPCRFFSAGI